MNGTLRESDPERRDAIAKEMLGCLNRDVGILQEQLVLILRNPETYKGLLACRDILAQQLLDLFQELLDSFPQSPARPRLSKALLRLSRCSGLHPTCFPLTDMETVGEQVAGGAFGDIWKAVVREQTVSVKIMRIFESEELEAALQIKNFGREAVIWRQLSHPNVLPFFGLYYLERRLCLISPWMENGHLLKFLKHAPPDTDLVSLMLDIALGLEYLHSEHVVHGDLKGMNILVTPSRRACVADFGLSSIADAMTLKFTHSTANVKGGTPRYMAPELLSFTEPLPNTFESDVFAFACVCYEILTGKPPYFDIPRDMNVIFLVLQGARPERPEIIPAPDSLWTLLEKCWETEPEDRPTASQIIQDLANPAIGARLSQCAIDWDATFSAKCRRSLQEWPLLPSVAAIQGQLFADSDFGAWATSLLPSVRIPSLWPTLHPVLAFISATSSRYIGFDDTSSPFKIYLTSTSSVFAKLRRPRALRSSIERIKVPYAMRQVTYRPTYGMRKASFAMDPPTVIHPAPPATVLLEKATSPPLPSMTLSHPRLLWTIDVKPLEGNFVLVRDVMRLDHEEQVQVHEAYNERCMRVPESRRLNEMEKGMKRLDLLGNGLLFAGLNKSQTAPAACWDLVLHSCAEH
ncbi:kinase-like domain-containing protein [Mycena filopes]|nr:kinase-like domain-containing protein [Mycena filopes]